MVRKAPCHAKCACCLFRARVTGCASRGHTEEDAQGKASLTQSSSPDTVLVARTSSALELRLEQVSPCVWYE